MAENDSPYFDDWKDEAARDRAKFIVREHYDQSKTYSQITHQAAADWGKWLVASLLAVHGGTLYTLSNLYQKIEPKTAVLPAVGMSVAGIVATILCGFFAWLNFQALNYHHQFYANPQRVHNLEIYSETPPKHKHTVAATYFLAAASGGFSIYFFIASAVAIVQGLSP